MADEGLMLVELPEAVSVADTDLVYLVTDLATLAASKRISIGNLKLAISGKAAGAHQQIQFNNTGVLAGSPSFNFQDSPSHPAITLVSPGRVDPVAAGATLTLSAGPVDNSSNIQTSGPFMIIKTQQPGYLMLGCGAREIYVNEYGINPANDAAQAYLGVPWARWWQTHVNDSITIGTTPAQAGAIRLANDGAAGYGNIAWRNFGNTGNVALRLTLQDRIDFSGGTMNPVGFDFVSTNGVAVSPSVTISHATLPQVVLTETGAAADLKTFRIAANSQSLYFQSVNDIGAPVASPLRLNRTGDAFIATSLAIGANASTSGMIRFPNNQGLRWRNAANTGDTGAISVDAANALLINAGAASIALLGTYVAIGTTVAQSGTLRFANNTSVKARNVGNTADLNLVSISTADNIVFGNLTSVNYWQGSIVNLESGNYVYISTPTGNYYITGQVFQPVTDSGPSLGHAAARWNSAYLSSHIAIADVPALSGDVRLANSHPINWRSANNAYDIGIYMDGAPSLRTPTIMPQGDGNYALGYPTLRWVYACLSDNVQIGTNPASSGALRMASDGQMKARNAANTADLPMIAMSSDTIFIASTATNVVVESDNLYFRFGTGKELQFYAAAEQLAILNTDSFLPEPTDRRDFGSTAKRWKAGWFSGAVTAGAMLAPDAYFNSLGATPLDATQLVGMVPPASLPAAGGSGDVVGPAGATDSAVAAFSGTTGKAIKNSTILISGSRLLIGGTGASFPALRNAGAELEVTTADNAQWAKVRASAFVSTQSGNNLQDLTVVGATSLNTLTVSGATSLVSLTATGRAVVFGGSGTSFSTAPLEIQAGTSRIAFHWPGVVASQIGVASDGTIRTYDNPGTGYAPLTASTITSTANVMVGTNLHNNGGYIYPGNYAASGAYQGSWWLGSHSSYGLFTNTGLYATGPLWSGASLNAPSVAVGMAVHNGVQAVTLVANNTSIALAANMSALRVTANGFSIQNITGGTAGQVLHVFSVAGSLYLATGGNLGGGTSAMSAGTGRTLYYDGGGWKLV